MDFVLVYGEHQGFTKLWVLWRWRFLDQTPNLEKWKEVTGMSFNHLITLVEREQGLNGVGMILFIEIGAKIANFWISLFGLIAFITLSMLIPAFDDVDLILTKWTVNGY